MQKVENAQSKAKVDEQEFNFKYEELKIELEHKFNDIVEEYSQIQTESEKRIALLEQENFFLKKENEKLYQDSEKSQIEISNFRLEIETLSDNNENLQKQISDLEIKKQQELLFLKNEFEKKIKEVFIKIFAYYKFIRFWKKMQSLKRKHLIKIKLKPLNFLSKKHIYKIKSIF